MNVETLAVRVQRDGPLNELDAVGWLIRLCKRVELLHELGVAHGGLSAHVIFTAGPECASQGLLGDVREAAIRPAYHSPERHAGQGVSLSDDAWALAVTLYFLLTGRLPFAGETSQEVRERIASVAPAPLAVFDVGDDELQRVLDQFLARDRAKRVSRVSTLRSLLVAWHANPEIAALPPLDDEDEEGSDDDDDDVKTVMRDFGEVRAQLEAMGAEGLPDMGLPPPPAAPPPPPPPALGGAPSASSPRAAPAAAPRVRPPPRQYAATALGGFDAAARMATERRAKRVTPATRPPVAPGGGGVGASPPPAVPAAGLPLQGPQALAAAMPQLPEAAPPPLGVAPGPGAPAADGPPDEMPVSDNVPRAPLQFEVDDSDSEDEVATVMMDVQGADLSSAIEAALAKQDISGGPAPGQAAPALFATPAAPHAAPMVYPGGQPGQSLEDLVIAHQHDDGGLKRALIVAVVLLVLVVLFVAALLFGEQGAM